MIEEAVNPVEGITELRSISGPGQSLVIVTFDLSRDIDAAAQDVRDRVAAVVRQPARRHRPAGHPEAGQRADADADGRAVRQPVDPRADRDRRQDGEGAARALHRRRRGADRRRPRARHQHLGRRRPPRRLSAADHRGPRRAAAAERRHARRQRHHRACPSARCARWAASPTRRSSTTWSSRRATAQPIRVRDIGQAEDGTKEQRSLARLNGVPTVVLEVRRQSGANTVEVIEAAKANARARRGRSCRRTCRLRGDPRPVALHLRRAARDQRPPGARQHPRLPGGASRSCATGARRSSPPSPFPTSVIATFGMMWALDFTLNSVTMLALVLMVGIVIDDAIVVLENIFRFVEEKGHERRSRPPARPPPRSRCRCWPPRSAWW